jgi:hypothetical protein
MVVGWGVFWQYAHHLPDPGEPEQTVSGNPEPIVADRSVEFETVTDRTPIEFRDMAAYSLLLARARGNTPAELAAVSRRDVVLAHLWQNPERYRGIPIHLEGTARRVIRTQAEMIENRWLYEAYVFTREAPLVPYICVFEAAPQGLPIGSDVSESVVFNGYFLKIMKYKAVDVVRGAPILVGRLGWRPHEPSSPLGTNTTLRWSLVVLGALFFISLARWIYQLRRFFSPHRVTSVASPRAATEEIDPATLNEWVRSMAPDVDSTTDPDDIA